MVPGPGRSYERPPRAPWWLLRNSDGRRDGAWTLCVATMLVLYVGMLIGGSELRGDAWTLRMPEPGGETVAVIISSIGAYVLRRRQQKLHGEEPPA